MVTKPKAIFFSGDIFHIFHNLQRREFAYFYVYMKFGAKKVVSPRLILRQGNILLLRRLSQITPNFPTGIIWEFTTIKVKSLQ